MREIENRKLTSHFMLYEFLEAQMPDEAVALNWKYITEDTVYRSEIIALELEKVRKLVNDNFKSDIGFHEIGLRITSGYRCIEWELLRDRSGNSQHTIMAVDLQPVRCSRELAVKILHFIYVKYNHFWSGGLAIKNPSKQGSILLVGFVHLDMRDKKARWKYN